MKYHSIPTLFDNQASLINGKNIGTDSVRYIQDAGQKTAGNTYIDRNTNELYVCVTTTNSVNNDWNFSKFNLKEAFNKLDNLNSGIEFIEIKSESVDDTILIELINNALQKSKNIIVSIVVYSGRYFSIDTRLIKAKELSKIHFISHNPKIYLTLLGVSAGKSNNSTAVINQEYGSQIIMERTSNAWTVRGIQFYTY